MKAAQKWICGGLLAASLALSLTPAFAKVNEYEGQHRAAAITERHVNEYEGQH